jgi:hypothetical protein
LVFRGILAVSVLLDDGVGAGVVTVTGVEIRGTLAE